MLVPSASASALTPSTFVYCRLHCDGDDDEDDDDDDRLHHDNHDDVDDNDDECDDDDGDDDGRVGRLGDRRQRVIPVVSPPLPSAFASLPRPRGLPPDFRIEGHLTACEALGKFIGEQIDERGLLKRGHGFFAQATTADGLRFLPPHAWFEFLFDDTGDGEDAAEAFFLLL